MGSARGHRLFAAIYDRANAAVERRWLGPLRDEVAGGARGEVLEVGAGTGANFARYRAGVAAHVLATEPDPHMRRRALARAGQAPVAIEVLPYAAEALAFEAGRFDTAVATLVF
jgi:ubiquinone/menaquinone biosynthesis C-methylase UbiE